MTPEEVRYKILSRLEERPDLNQRDMARELGVSLGKVNYCLKALVDKGFVKAGNFSRSSNKSAYLYILTPTGIDEKLRQTKAFLERKRTEYDLLRQEIQRLNEALARSQAEESS